MSTETVIAERPPQDGREWDSQCARCGSTVTSVDCEQCGGEGVDGHDCGEDSCCCLDPEDNVRCGACLGKGVFRVCLSTPEWCEAHPSPGREGIERGAVEWFTNETAPEVARG